MIEPQNLMALFFYFYSRHFGLVVTGKVTKSEVIDTKPVQIMALDQFSDWAVQHSSGSFLYETAAQQPELFRCAFSLRFCRLRVDEFSRVATFSDDAQNRMTLIGIIGAELEERGNCATLTIKCRKDPALGCQDRYTFTI